MREFTDRAAGRWSDKVFKPSVAGPLALLAFWGGMSVAAHAYPGGYDWRYQTISVLLYPDQNPHGYIWAWAGLELCGLAGIAWSADLNRRPETATARPGARGLRLLQLGFVCMCCALLPDRLLPLPKGHEIFAILAFLGICIGVTGQMSVLVDRRQVLPWRKHPDRNQDNNGNSHAAGPAGPVVARGPDASLPHVGAAETALGHSELADTRHFPIPELRPLGMGELRRNLDVPGGALVPPREILMPI